MNGIDYGADYYPEQWAEDVWIEDVRLMREAGVTLARVGVFAWSRIQPREGAFEFGWLDRVLDLLHDGGIRVALATATASPPHWLALHYPDSLPRTREGVILGPGSRQHYAPTSIAYRRAAGALTQAIAERYATHPAVQLWHVNNEYGCHVSADYSDNAATAFREWVEKRYGTIDALNSAWGTAFWSQHYASFAEVLPPRAAPYSVNPASWLDFKRFTSDSFRELFRMEKGIIRAAGASQPVTTNFMGAFEAIDYWSWADDVDVVSDDAYPDPADPESFRDAAFTRDLMRSIGSGRPWLLMEQAASAVNWRQVNEPKAPGQMAALSRQAIARGASGVAFFQWRQSITGAEKFHSAMLPHGGTTTRTWREIVELGHTLQALPEPVAHTPMAETAILFDWDTRWSLDAPDHPAQLDYAANVLDWYRELHRRNVPVDIAPPGANLDRYRLVIAPHLAVLREQAAASLVAWVEGGGNLVTTAFTDVVDENERFLPGGYLTRLSAVVGAVVSEHEGVLAPIGVELAGTSATAVGLVEVLEIDDAEVLGHFTDGWRAGRPALVRRRSAHGTAIHLGAVVNDIGIGAVLDLALAEAGIAVPFAGVPNGVEIIPRGSGYVAINHGHQPVAFPIGGTVLRLEPREVLEVPQPR